MKKLHRIRSPWRRFIFSLILIVLLVLNRFTSQRARCHWIGPRRHRRPERLMIVILFLSATLFLEPREYAYWAALTGGMISIFLVLYMVYAFIPRKRAHWIES